MRNYLLQLFYTYSVGDYLTGSTLFSADRLLLEKRKRIQKIMRMIRKRINITWSFWPLKQLYVIPHSTAWGQYSTAERTQVTILQKKMLLINPSITFLYSAMKERYFCWQAQCSDHIFRTDGIDSLKLLFWGWNDLYTYSVAFKKNFTCCPHSQDEWS